MAQISGPLGAKFGNDPQTFIINAANKLGTQMAQLTARMASRTGVSKWTTKPKGGKAFSSRMIASSHDSPPQIALILCLWAAKAPTVLVDEANRFAAHLPVGPKVRSLDAPIPTSEQVDPLRPVSAVRNLFVPGDELIIVGAICALLPIILNVVLPFLMSLVGGKSVEDAANAAVGGAPPVDAGAAPPPANDANPSIFDKISSELQGMGIPPEAALVGLALIVGVVGVLVLKK